MTPIGYTLLVAYELIMLTFSLGVLILALPIPLRGLKAWGSRMIVDSISAFILLSLYATLIELSNTIPSLLGWTWEGFYTWYDNALALVFTLKTIIASLIAAAKTLYMSQLVSSLLGPIDRLVNIMLIALVTIGTLSTIIRATYQYLAALGIALYALPARIGKSAGAWLLSFAIIFNAGIPLLPSFLNYATSAQPSIPEGLGATFAKINVVDLQGYPVDSGYVEVYAPVNNTLERVAVYHVSESDGTLLGKYGSDYVSLPSDTISYWALVVDSVYLPLYPLPLNGTQSLNTSSAGYTATLHADNLLFLTKYKLVYYSAGQIYSIDRYPDGVVVSLYLDAGEYVEALAPEGCEISLSYTGDGHVDEGSWSWLGVTGTFKRYTADSSGFHQVVVAFSGDCPSQPNLPEIEDYALDYLGLAGLSRNTIPNMLLSLLLLPSIYLFILSSITAAMARFLGGRERLLPRL